MTKVKVKFRPSSATGRPGSIVYLVACHNSVRQITTGYRLFPDEWIGLRSQTVRQISGRITQDIGRKMLHDIERLNRIIAKFDSLYVEYTPDDVIREYRRIVERNSFFGFMESSITRLKRMKRNGTANNYRAALNSFKRFRNQEDILIEAIDRPTIEDYQAQLISAGLTRNSVSFYMRILRAVYNQAVEQRIVPDRKPFRNAFTGMDKTRKRAIPAAFIKRIRDLDLSLHPGLAFARDVFMFLFFCRGMSFIDAAFLKKSDIHGNVLTYRRHKTGQSLQIKMIRQISEIIQRYYVNDSPYLLPIIAHPGTNERKQYESALRRTNNALKIIAEMTGLTVPLTTYVSRHTWATIAKSKDVPVSVISDALGHNSTATTQIYLMSVDTSAIDRANELIINNL